MPKFTTSNLAKALKLQRKIESLQTKIETQSRKLAILLGGEIPVPFKKGKNKMSAAGRARIAAAQKKRWAKIKGKSGKKGRRKMSAAGRAKIAAAARKRWAEAKKAGKNRL